MVYATNSNFLVVVRTLQSGWAVAAGTLKLAWFFLRLGGFLGRNFVGYEKEYYQHVSIQSRIGLRV